MCGRFANAEPMDALRHHYGATGPAEAVWQPSWNVCPTRDVPVLLGGGGRRIGLMRWGWNPAAISGRLLINCRGEEAHRKPLFQAALARRRCVVPATGFYEWRPAEAKGERGQPYAFAQRSRGLFAIAGFWEPPGQVILLTVPANAVVEPVHHRMPLVLGEGDLDAWLDPHGEGFAGLITTPQAEPWHAWKVGHGVTNPKVDGPEVFAQPPANID